MKKKKEEENENKKKHEINKNEATLRERIVLIFRILIQMFLSLQKKERMWKKRSCRRGFCGGVFFGLKVGRACFYQSDTAWSQHLQEFFHCTTKEKKKHCPDCVLLLFDESPSAEKTTHRATEPSEFYSLPNGH